jgi:hypothetical protein
VKDYTSIKKAVNEKIAALVDTEVIVGSKKHGTMNWKVVGCHTPPNDKLISKASTTFGLKNFPLSNYRKSKVLVDFFLQISFLDWDKKVEKMNRAIASSKCKCKKFSFEEFLIGLGLLIEAAEFSQKWVDLFVGKKGEEDEEDIDQWPSISPNPHFAQLMALNRFKYVRRFYYAEEM